MAEKRSVSESMEDVQQIVTSAEGVRSLSHNTLLEIGEKVYAQVHAPDSRDVSLRLPRWPRSDREISQVMAQHPLPWRVIRHG